MNKLNARKDSLTGIVMPDLSDHDDPWNDEEAVETLRESLEGSLQNLAMMAAFMCALGASAYFGLPQEGKCFGSWWLGLGHVLLWVSMGSYFLVIMFCVLLAADISGVPNSLLILHLRRVTSHHALTQLLCLVGTFLLAAGYGVDLNERLGCPSFPFALLAAPAFPVCGVFFLGHLNR